VKGILITALLLLSGVISILVLFRAFIPQVAGGIGNSTIESATDAVPKVEKKEN
jgi:hypothetical protein